MSSDSEFGIQYPFAEIPQKGEWIEVAKGVFWLQMSLPMALDHINLYVLEDDAGWWIVDTGMKIGDTRERWELLLANQMSGKPVLGVICTHMHPDHCGQAGWLCNSLRVPLYMSALEFLSARTFTTIPQGEMSWTAEQHFRRAGVGPRPGRLPVTIRHVRSMLSTQRVAGNAAQTSCPAISSAPSLGRAFILSRSFD